MATGSGESGERELFLGYEGTEDSEGRGSGEQPVQCCAHCLRESLPAIALCDMASERPGTEQNGGVGEDGLRGWTRQIRAKVFAASAPEPWFFRPPGLARRCDQSIQRLCALQAHYPPNCILSTLPLSPTRSTWPGESPHHSAMVPPRPRPARRRACGGSGWMELDSLTTSC